MKTRAVSARFLILLLSLQAVLSAVAAPGAHAQLEIPAPADGDCTARDVLLGLGTGSLSAAAVTFGTYLIINSQDSELGERLDVPMNGAAIAGASVGVFFIWLASTANTDVGSPWADMDFTACERQRPTPQGSAQWADIDLASINLSAEDRATLAAVAPDLGKRIATLNLAQTRAARRRLAQQLVEWLDAELEGRISDEGLAELRAIGENILRTYASLRPRLQRGTVDILRGNDASLYVTGDGLGIRF